MRTTTALICSGVVVLACACSPQSDSSPEEPASVEQTQTPTPSPTDTPTETPSDTPTEAPELPAIAPADFDVDSAMATVQHLAGTIGPRQASGPAYERAARWVARQFEGQGYDVRRQRVDVPAGSSWGVEVPGGRSDNVIATPAGFDPQRPHLIVGAHLDSVAVAPGAEDNASGVAVMLAAAEAAAETRTRLPVVFIAFGGEEPRSASDPEVHHFGSRAYVAALSPAERDAIRAMISLDRVGVGGVVPVGSASDSDPIQQQLLAAAERAGVAVTPVSGSRSSDHWSFVRDGLPAARLGSTSYAAYHSAQDVPSVIQPEQIGRVGRITLAWLAPR